MTEAIVPGALYVVSTPIGNLGDITQRAVHILREVDLIAAEDTRTTRVLLDHLAISKPLLSYFSYNEARRIPELLERLSGGQAIAVVTDAGTPGVSDPACAVIRAAIARSIRVIPVPGASALLPALVGSGLPTDRFAFEGFLPVKKGRKTRLAELADEPRTIVLYEAPHRLERTLEEILSVLGDRDIALGRELTKKFEEFFRGTVTEALEHVRRKAPRGEYVLVVRGKSSKRKRVEECDHAGHAA